MFIYILRHPIFIYTLFGKQILRQSKICSYYKSLKEGHFIFIHGYGTSTFGIKKN